MNVHLNEHEFSAIIRVIAEMEVDAATARRALNKGAEVVQERIKNEAPERYGTLKENILIEPDGEDVIVHSGRAGHAHIIEGGRKKGKKRVKTKSGKWRVVRWGHMDANPFFSRAYEASKGKATEVIAEELRRG